PFYARARLDTLVDALRQHDRKWGRVATSPQDVRMNFVDKTLVRLADPATRAAVFDAASLEACLAAGYDTSAQPVAPPFQPVFDDLRLSRAVPPLTRVEGGWRPLGDAMGARFDVAGGGPAPRIEALWCGAIVARTSPATGRITAAAAAWPSLARVDE